jgi:PAT family beta-lactamase induction signal transducer AmpG
VFMLVGLVTTALTPEPAASARRPRTLLDAVVTPLRSFFATRGVGRAALVLIFMLLYKLGDTLATALLTPFYLDVGFSLTQIAAVAKVAALGAAVVGGLLGGALMLRTGINRALWLFGVVQVVSILGFAGLAIAGPNEAALFAAVALEYLGIGLGTVAFVAFIARETDKRYTAFQLALLTSLTGVPATFLSSLAGAMAENLGWTAFFFACAGLALPGMAMLPLVAPWGRDPGPEGDGAS